MICNVLWPPWCKNITKQISTTETQSKPNEKGPPHVEWLILKDKMMGSPGVRDETTYGINHLPNARAG